MKVLVIVAHPNIKDSIVNRRWVEELRNIQKLRSTNSIIVTLMK